MSFSLTEEQEMLRQTARKFAQKEIIPVAAQHDRDGEFPREIVQKAFDTGLMNDVVPPEYGGPGTSYTDTCIISEELGAGCAGVATTIIANSLALTPIVLVGTDEQKKRFLTPMCEKLTFAAFCLTEPGAGSDVGAISTTAVRDGDCYVINGTKHFITNGGVADHYTVFASTDRSKGARGLSAIVVRKDETSGVSTGKELDKMGQRASNTTEVVFEDVRVPVENRLGKEGDGFKIAMMTFDTTRPVVAAVSVGVARAAYEYAVEYVKERVQFGAPLAKNQAIQFEIADMAMKISAARLLTWHAAWLVDQGIQQSKESAFAKAFAADTAMEITTKAVQLFGGYGYSKEYPVEKLMRDAKLLQIYEGTSEIQRLVIARNVFKGK
ncbi:MAG: acyl-CoA dehydrogenase family protein [Candidatus Hydrogenedentes bacterium]|nr:acyl-CoA dehydrogenase family protein [Candidatus Hydrogenedentota bacterium]